MEMHLPYVTAIHVRQHKERKHLGRTVSLEVTDSNGETHYLNLCPKDHSIEVHFSDEEKDPLNCTRQVFT